VVLRSAGTSPKKDTRQQCHTHGKTQNAPVEGGREDKARSTLRQTAIPERVKHPRQAAIRQAPPSRESSTLSVRNCRTRRSLDAPMESRTPTSLVRAVARASSRLATLMHAISKTTIDTPSRILAAS